MHKITLRVISGADRGRVFRELAPPITIGREEGNTVQLNDERISRFHVKIQEDGGRLVITDLDSTNGTRINGHACNLKILRYGDTISVGRTVLLAGTREQVAEWFAEEHTAQQPCLIPDSDPGEFDSDMSTGLAAPNSDSQPGLDVCLPRGLSAAQSAELRELLDHLHGGLRAILENASVDENNDSVTIDIRAWQSLLMTQSEVAELIRCIEDPDSDAGYFDSHTGSD